MLIPWKSNRTASLAKWRAFQLCIRSRNLPNYYILLFSNVQFSQNIGRVEDTCINTADVHIITEYRRTTGWVAWENTHLEVVALHGLPYRWHKNGKVSTKGHCQCTNGIKCILPQLIKTPGDNMQIQNSLSGQTLNPSSTI
jgi:hypothetical protein